MRNLRGTLATALLAAVIVIGFQQIGRMASALQNELVPPLTGTYSGVEYSQLLGDAFRSLASCNKGSSAPANVDGAAVDGQCWIDDSVSPWLKKRYADGTWVIEGAIDDANGIWVGVLGGGTATVASASTTNLASVPQANVTISGTTTINAFGSAAPEGAIKFIRFSGALTLTHSANIKVPGGYSLTTAADDRAIVTHLGSGAWEITQYTRASGVPVDVSAVGDIKFGIRGAVPSLHVAGTGQALLRSSYPAYLAAATRGQNGTRTSSSRVITGLATTAGFGVGMPVEGTGIPSGATISSVDSSSQITLDAGHAASSSGTATVTVFLTGYGSAGDSTTVGVPDCTGRLVAGLDSAGARITSAGSSINGAAQNASGGAQTVAFTVSTSNMPAHTHTGTTDNGGVDHTHTANDHSVAGGNGNNIGTTSAFNGLSTFSQTTSGASAYLHTHTFTTGSTGSGSSITLNNMPPTLVAECVVRVTP